MNLNSKEADIVFRLMAELSAPRDSKQLRLHVGRLLLDLLNADHFASYVWNPAKEKFGQRVSINMADDNLQSYEDHYQFCDPITPVLQRRTTATPVSDIMAQERLERTEFFNDFLSRDGLRFGINFHAHKTGRNIGDLRIWRSTGKENFSRRDVELLDAIGLPFTNSMQACLDSERNPDSEYGIWSTWSQSASRQVGLTSREMEIAVAIALGKSDKSIAAEIGVSFSTVRTHIKNIFRKLNVRNRTQLVSKIRRN